MRLEQVIAQALHSQTAMGLTHWKQLQHIAAVLPQNFDLPAAKLESLISAANLQDLPTLVAAVTESARAHSCYCIQLE